MTHTFVGTVYAERTCSWQILCGWMYTYFSNLYFIDLATVAYNGWIVSPINLSTNLEILTM